ncbi:MAG TPA: acyl-CoA dehydrogenase family protein [Acidimicrobiia bacterium]|nr:acyl-CoA dehydrogenase family protein [Acidimicrobiia bacterium]
MPDMLTAARAVTDVVEREAAASEAAGTLTAAVVNALHEARLFRLMTPKELGGEEADLTTVLAVYEEVTRADASTGWSLLANATTTGFAGAFLGDRAVKAMFGGDADPVHAGQFAPRGTSVAVDGGYEVAGRYSFGSGCAHAGWIGGGTIEVADGEPAVSERGLPVIRAFFVPAGNVELLGNWDVMGLCGTGSYDYAVTEQTVDEAYTFRLVEDEPQRGGPLYRLGVLGLTAVGHAAFALGVGKRALEELVAVVGGKQRLGATAPVRDQQLFRHDLGVHDAALRAARAFVFEVFDDAQTTLERGEEASVLQRQRLRQATTYATRVAVDTVRFAYTWAGTDALRTSVLQRCFRDMHAATQHVFVDNDTMTETGRLLLDVTAS